MNDVISIDTTSTGGVKVTLNGPVAQFDAGAITSNTVIDGGGGTDTINVETSSGPSATIVDDGSADQLYGNGGSNWFLPGANGVIHT